MAPKCHTGISIHFHPFPSISQWKYVWRGAQRPKFWGKKTLLLRATKGWQKFSPQETDCPRHPCGPEGWISKDGPRTQRDLQKHPNKKQFSLPKFAHKCMLRHTQTMTGYSILSHHPAHSKAPAVRSNDSRLVLQMNTRNPSQWSTNITVCTSSHFSKWE